MKMLGMVTVMMNSTGKYATMTVAIVVELMSISYSAKIANVYRLTSTLSKRNLTRFAFSMTPLEMADVRIMPMFQNVPMIKVIR